MLNTQLVKRLMIIAVFVSFFRGDQAIYFVFNPQNGLQTQIPTGAWGNINE